MGKWKEGKEGKEKYKYNRKYVLSKITYYTITRTMATDNDREDIQLPHSKTYFNLGNIANPRRVYGMDPLSQTINFPRPTDRLKDVRDSINTNVYFKVSHSTWINTIESIFCKYTIHIYIKH